MSLRAFLISFASAFGLVAVSNTKLPAPENVKLDGITGPMEIPYTSESVEDILTRVALDYGIDPLLVIAIAKTESSLNPTAYRAESGGKGSYGLMQILCPSRLIDIEGWNEYGPPDCADLYDPEYNAKIGCQILKWNQAAYGFWRGVAIYNRWASKDDPLNGPYGNQSYVDKVKRFYSND